MTRQLAILALVGFALSCSSDDKPGRNPGDSGPPPTAGNAAKVFFPAPATSGVDIDDLIDVELNGVIPATPGGYLRGFHLETYNCCKRYTCPAGATECDAADRICAADDDATAIESRVALSLPAEMVPFDLSQFGFSSDTVYAETVFCTEAPRLTSQGAGWLAVPVDSTRSDDLNEGLASETDAFVEVQVYHATQTFFEHIRHVLEDQTFCLAHSSMQCAEDGNAMVDADGVPLRAFHITTNFLFPEVDFAGLAAQLLPPPFGQGRGETADNPVLIEDFQRVSNAAFIPALEDTVGVPPELAPLAEQFNRPYDSNMYFQGERDFGYDGDIVFHEFTHAVVHTFVPNLQSMGRDSWGSHAEPGAMNEGWSDYFAASFTDSSITGEYGGSYEGTGIRDADNDDSCPASIIGQVHQDSLPWSGALWDLRQAVQADLGDAGVDALDELLLLAMAESDDDETMDRQAGRIQAALAADATLASYASAATAAFTSRGIIACDRVRTIASVDAGSVTYTPIQTLMQPSPAAVGLTNMAPSAVQLRVEVPPGSPGFAVGWTQSAGGMGGLGGGAESPLAVVVHEDTPIEWQYVGSVATAHESGGASLGFDPADVANQATLGPPGGTGTVDATFDVTLTASCQLRTFYLSLVATTEGPTLANVAATVEADSLGCP